MLGDLGCVLLVGLLHRKMLRCRPLSYRCMHMSGAESTCWAWQGQTWFNAWQPYFSLPAAAPYLDSTGVGGVSPPDDMYLYQSMCDALGCTIVSMLRYSIAACNPVRWKTRCCLVYLYR